MEWKAEFATGIRNIDNQHKEIVEIVTLYETLAENKASWQEVQPLILRTREFMEFHCSVEESLMRLLPYPGCEAHRAEHRRELQELADIGRWVQHADMRDRLAPLLRQRLIGHIVAGDKRLAQYALSLFGQRSPGNGKDRIADVAVNIE